MQRTALGLVVIGSILTGLAGCRSEAAAAAGPEASRWSYVPDLPVSAPPFERMEVSYKERLDQPYVFVEVRGSYTDTGRNLPELDRRMRAAGVVASGPPFGLFYDDPGRTPLAELRSRACLPVDGAPPAAAGLAYDVLAPATVVYAVVSGPYPGVPRAYPGLLAYAERMGWVENGPVREIYLVSPDAVASYAELLCEIQVPVTQRP